MNRAFLGISAAVLVAFLSSPVTSQTPVDRLDLEPEIIGLLEDHGATLETMAEVVVEIRDNMATKDHAQAITSNLAAIRAKLDAGRAAPTPAPVVESATVPIIGSGLPVGPGERIVAINGVPVGQTSTTVPAGSTIVNSQPSSVTYSHEGPFVKRSVTTTGTGNYTTGGFNPVTIGSTAPAGCYIDANGQRQCPSNSYNPQTVTTPQNDLGRRRGLFGGFFRR